MTQVIYIAGMLRSGSTLLGACLGSVPEIATMGETVVLWRAAAEGRLCGCREPLKQCPVWGPVIDEVLAAHPTAGGLRGIDALVTGSVRVRQTWRLARPGGVDSEASRYAEILRTTYDAFARATGSRVLVDGSKSPAVAALLPGICGGEFTGVHLVRNPWAVAASERGERAWEVSDDLAPPSRSAVRSALTWTMYNLAAAHLVRRAQPGRWISLRYEDFVDAPQVALDNIAQAAGLASVAWPFVAPNTIELRTSHDAAGNPNRFETSRREITRRDGWQHELGGGARRRVTIVAAPLARRLGYRDGWRST
jgi:hypothetical protein